MASTHPNRLGRGRVVDELGKRYDKLVVVARSLSPRRGSVAWLCRCDCGNERVVLGIQLRSGTVRSCGCNKVKHHRASEAIYKRWCGMVARCSNPKHVAYPLYGGRGIRVCERWLSFENFYADMGECPRPGMSLDRIDVNGEYSPANVRWADSKTQRNNQRAAPGRVASIVDAFVQRVSSGQVPSYSKAEVADLFRSLRFTLLGEWVPSVGEKQWR